MWLLKNKPKEEAVEVVECDECKSLIAKNNAKRVVKTGYVGSLTYFYCESHKPLYDKVIYFGIGGAVYSRDNVEVDEHGEPVGYTKSKKVANLRKI